MPLRPEGRILAIDYGERRIGLAISDELGIIASGLGTLQNRMSLIDDIAEIVRLRCCVRVIIGLPLTLRGEHGRAAATVTDFVVKLRSMLPIPVEMIDERFTSSLAQQAILDMGVGKKKRRDKGKIDEIAAVILLQGYLSREQHS